MDSPLLFVVVLQGSNLIHIFNAVLPPFRLSTKNRAKLKKGRDGEREGGDERERVKKRVHPNLYFVFIYKYNINKSNNNVYLALPNLKPIGSQRLATTIKK